jgi:BirA family transcriptional regulator, biotin operon repressor / biotin---[acetyl-CoA-carboxylase] ligase
MKNFEHPFFDQIFYFNTINSTQKKAEHLIRTETANGNFLILSKEQTGGIGRKDNYWFAPPGGIWATSAIYSIPFKSGVTLFTGICVHKAILEYCSNDLGISSFSDLTIKWPNDIYWQDRKLCGILSSYMDHYKYHTIGIGINTNNTALPDQIKDLAVSLKGILNKEIDNEILLKKIFDRFSQDFPQFIEQELDVEYYQKNSFLRFKKVTVDTEFDKFTGEALGINSKGALLVKLGSGMIQPFYSGTIDIL